MYVRSRPIPPFYHQPRLHRIIHHVPQRPQKLPRAHRPVKVVPHPKRLPHPPQMLIGQPGGVRLVPPEERTDRHLLHPSGCLEQHVYVVTHHAERDDANIPPPVQSRPGIHDDAPNYGVLQVEITGIDGVQCPVDAQLKFRRRGELLLHEQCLFGRRAHRGKPVVQCAQPLVPRPQ